jgi:hypothetical protein
MTEPTWLDQPNADQAHAMLLDRYMEVLDAPALARIGITETRGILSGLFLPDVPDAYVRSRFRVMLIGQETRGWNGRLSDLGKCGSAGNAMRDHVETSMQRHLGHSLTVPNKSKFMQFYDELHQSLGTHVEPERNAVFWGNLLCVSLNSGTPVKADHIQQMQELSRQLLTIQLDVLRPHAVVFASGWRYDKFIKAALPSYETHHERLVPKRFWPFTTVGGPAFEGYRVPHPRAHDKAIRRHVLQAVTRQCDAWAAANAA